MAVLFDLICAKCGEVLRDQPSSDEGKLHCRRGGFLEILWNTRAGQANPSDAEKCVVYVSDKEGGAVQYPHRNDKPVPEYLAKRGYERREILPREMSQFERRHNVQHSASNYDKGSGNEYRG